MAIGARIGGLVFALTATAGCQFGTTGGGGSPGDGTGGDDDGAVTSTTGSLDATASGSAGDDGSGFGDGNAPDTGAGDDATTGTTATLDDTTGGCAVAKWYLDEDGDGFGDPDRGVAQCDAPSRDHVDNGEDCDDAAPAINPGVDEVCDDIDNDCDLGIDEGSPANASCDGCDFYPSNDGTAWFAHCPGPLFYDEAREACGVYGLGADLATIDDPVDDALLLDLAEGDVWIGISDLDEEGHWVWVDGTDAVVDGAHVGYDGWGPGEPNGRGVENCAEYDTNVGAWNDGGCDQGQPYYCRHPA